MNVQIIIPCYRSAATIGTLVRELFSVMKDFSAEILLIDDCSPDSTREEILRLSAEFPRIRYHFSAVNKGQQESLRIGLRLIDPSADYVVTMDDDMQHPASVIPALLEKAQQGFDLVYAVPESDIQKSLLRRSPVRIAGSAMRDALFSFFINKPRGLRVGSFRVMTRELAEKAAASSRKYFYLSAEVFRFPLRAANIFYPYLERPSGHSGYTVRKLALIYLRLLFTYKIKLFYGGGEE